VLGDVGDVEPVRLLWSEVPLHQVVGRGRALVASGAAAQPPAVHALQPGDAHQASDPAVADLDVLAQHKLGVHPAVAVGAVGGGVDFADGVDQVGLLPPAAAGRPAVPLVVAGGRDLQDPAGRRDGDAVGGELSDHRADHFGRTFSRAK
jgi:hypothetical protein